MKRTYGELALQRRLHIVEFSTGKTMCEWSINLDDAVSVGESQVILPYCQSCVNALLKRVA